MPASFGTTASDRGTDDGTGLFDYLLNGFALPL